MCSRAPSLATHALSARVWHCAVRNEILSVSKSRKRDTAAIDTLAINPRIQGAGKLRANEKASPTETTPRATANSSYNELILAVGRRLAGIRMQQHEVVLRRQKSQSTPAPESTTLSSTARTRKAVAQSFNRQRESMLLPSSWAARKIPRGLCLPKGTSRWQPFRDPRSKSRRLQCASVIAVCSKRSPGRHMH